MGKKADLSSVCRAQIIVMKDEGYSERQISKKLNVSKTAVHNAIVKHEVDGIFTARERSGRPRATTSRDDHIIRRIAVRSPRSSLKKIKAALLAAGRNVSLMTVSRRLSKEFGLSSRIAAKKPRLTPAMKLKRLQFAKKYQFWSADEWGKVLFSDESCLQQFANRSRKVRRPRGKRYDERYTAVSVRQGPRQMVWGAMSASGTAALYFLPKKTTMNGSKYLDLLKEKLELHMAVHDCNIFMHDGAPCHRSKLVTSYLKQENITVLDWPGNSPDLNPIENLWTVLKDKVSDMQPTSCTELISAIKSVWCTGISSDYCKTLVNSMPQRIQAVITRRGGITRY